MSWILLAVAVGLVALLVSVYNALVQRRNRYLSEELTSTENKVAFARQAFNDAVMDYNTLRESFPANLIAGRYGFQAAELLDIGEPAARQAPRVTFG